MSKDKIGVKVKCPTCEGSGYSSQGCFSDLPCSTCEGTKKVCAQLAEMPKGWITREEAKKIMVEVLINRGITNTMSWFITKQAFAEGDKNGK